MRGFVLDRITILHGCVLGNFQAGQYFIVVACARTPDVTVSIQQLGMVYGPDAYRTYSRLSDFERFYLSVPGLPSHLQTEDISG